MGERVRRPRLTAGPETWALVKAGFLAGHSAAVLGRHYGVRPGEIYRRSCHERWVRTEDGEAPVSRPSRPEAALPPPPEPVAGDAGALPPAGKVEPVVLPPPPPPRPAPAIDKRRLAASALEGAARLLAEGRLEEAAAYMKLADMGSRVGERGPAEAPTPEQARRWEAARAFYTGETIDRRDLSAHAQWELVTLMSRHAAERRHVLDAMKAERRDGRRCACALCAALSTTRPESMAQLMPEVPATDEEAAALTGKLVVALASG